MVVSKFLVLWSCEAKLGEVAQNRQTRHISVTELILPRGSKLHSSFFVYDLLLVVGFKRLPKKELHSNLKGMVKRSFGRTQILMGKTKSLQGI